MLISEKQEVANEFFEPWEDTDTIKEWDDITSHLVSYIYQPYCWQVALRQSLLPLGADTLKIKKFFVLINFINHHRR